MMPGRVFTAGQETREGYTGHELDAETGMYYAGARYYMPALARWMAIDPLADEFHAWNPYNYVMGNPLSLVDPTGLAPEQCSEGESDITPRICGRLREEGTRDSKESENTNGDPSNDDPAPRGIYIGWESEVCLFTFFCGAVVPFVITINSNGTITLSAEVGGGIGLSGGGGFADRVIQGAIRPLAFHTRSSAGYTDRVARSTSMFTIHTDSYDVLSFFLGAGKSGGMNVILDPGTLWWLFEPGGFSEIPRGHRGGGITSGAGVGGGASGQRRLSINVTVPIILTCPTLMFP